MEVKTIYWNRANINIELNGFIKEEALLIDQNNNIIKLDIKKKNTIIINITNTPYNSCLKSGKYHILVDKEKLKINKELIKYLSNYSKIFKYNNNFYACIVDFDVDDNKTIYINIDYMMKNKKYNKKYRLTEGNTLAEKLSILFKIILISQINILYKIIRLFSPLYKKNILFLTESTNTINDNLKILYEHMKNSPKCNKLHLKINAYNIYKTKSIKKHLKEILDIATCNTIIIDNYVSILNILPISKSQKIIQLWHAGIGFKAVGYARFGLNGGPHPIYSSHRKYTYVVVDNEELIDIYSEVFGIEKTKILPLGMPRLDNYLKKERLVQVSNNLFKENIELKTKKIILFAPTYRGENQKQAYYNMDKIELKRIYEFCKNNNFIFIIKMHNFIKDKISIPKEYNKLILDYTNHNINDLIYITDIMITDYSSCAYEYSFFNKPIIYYRYDKELYEYKRGIHTKDILTKKTYEALNFEELIEILNSLKNVEIENRFKNLSNTKRNSCDNIIEKILGD